MVTVSAIYGPHKGQSLLGHHFLCFCKSLSPTKVPRDQRQHIYFQWASVWPHSHQCTQSYKRIVFCPNLQPPIRPFTADTLHKEIMHGICPQRAGLPTPFRTASRSSPQYPETHGKAQFGASLSLEKEKTATLVIMATCSSQGFGEGTWLPGARVASAVCT